MSQFYCYGATRWCDSRLTKLLLAWQNVEEYFFPRHRVKWLVIANFPPIKEALLKSFPSKVMGSRFLLVCLLAGAIKKISDVYSAFFHVL